jgi:hypothetical protein
MLKPPIEISYEQLKQMLDVGGVDNLTDEHALELLLLIPCFIMSLREKEVDSFRNLKIAKSVYNKVNAEAFLNATGSVETRKAAASIEANVFAAEQDYIRSEVNYESIRHAADDWLELCNGLKRLVDKKRLPV